MATHDADALQRKAQNMRARLERQTANMIARAHVLGAGRGPKSSPSASFLAGFKYSSGLFPPTGGPKTSIRAASADGLKSFHFAVGTISRTSDLSKTIAAATGKPGSAPSSSSAAHQKYIEREAAVEAASEIAANEISSASASRSSSEDIAEIAAGSEKLVAPESDGYASASAAYIDRDGALESSSASFGTIAPSIEDRLRFWDAVEASERKPTTNTVTLNPDVTPEFWDRVRGDDRAPELLKSALSSNAIVSRKLPNDAALALYLYAHDQGISTTDRSGPLVIEPGRGGRIQSRLVAELPHDMTPGQRIEIAQRFCKEECFDRSAPFHCAIHAPSEKNHDRNFHLHVSFYDRPAKIVPHPLNGLKIWDFEYIEQFRDSKRTLRQRRPLQQDKIRELHNRDWPKTARARFAAIVNDVRRQSGLAPNYDPRSYADMGLDIAPVPALTRGEYIALAKGVANPVATAKIEKRWERLIRKVAQEAETPAFDPKIEKRLSAFTETVKKRAPGSTMTAIALHGRYRLACKAEADAKAEIAAIDLALQRAKASASPPFNKKAQDRISPRFFDALRRDLTEVYYRRRGLSVLEIKSTIKRLDAHEKSLAKLSPGDLTLPMQTIEELAERAGLGKVYAFLKQQAAETIQRRPDLAPPATVRPADPPASVPPTPAPSAAPPTIDPPPAPDKSPGPIAALAAPPAVKIEVSPPPAPEPIPERRAPERRPFDWNDPRHRGPKIRLNVQEEPKPVQEPATQPEPKPAPAPEAIPTTTSTLPPVANRIAPAAASVAAAPPPLPPDRPRPAAPQTPPTTPPVETPRPEAPRPTPAPPLTERPAVSPLPVTIRSPAFEQPTPPSRAPRATAPAPKLAPLSPSPVVSPRTPPEQPPKATPKKSIPPSPRAEPKRPVVDDGPALSSARPPAPAVPAPVDAPQPPPPSPAATGPSDAARLAQQAHVDAEREEKLERLRRMKRKAALVQKQNRQRDRKGRGPER